MDIKFIILFFLAVVTVVILVTSVKGIDTMRNNFDKTITNITCDIDKKFKLLRTKQSADNVTLIAKLQKENKELVNQVRRMNTINNQSIRCSNEYMTAETSDDYINYLSDNKKEQCINKSSSSSVFLSKTNSNNKKLNRLVSVSEDDNKDNDTNSNKNEDEWKVKKNGETIENDEMIENIKVTDKSQDDNDDDNNDNNDDENDDNDDDNDDKVNSSDGDNKVIVKSEKDIIDNNSINIEVDFVEQDDVKCSPIVTYNSNSDTSSNDSNDSSKSISINSLKSINKYTVKDLKNIAKKWSVPVTLSDDEGKRRNLKKTELYEKINNYLKN
jgi:hypothetical protein